MAASSVVTPFQNELKRHSTIAAALGMARLIPLTLGGAQFMSFGLSTNSVVVVSPTSSA